MKAEKPLTLVGLFVAVLILCALLNVFALWAIDLLSTPTAEVAPEEETSCTAEPVVTSDLDPAAAAVKLGVETFYTIDYEAGEEAWLENICAVSTQSGCQSIRTFHSYSWAVLMSEHDKADIACTASPLAMLSEAKSANEWTQIWVVEYTISDQGDDNNEPQLVVAVAAFEDGEWKLNWLEDDYPQSYMNSWLEETPKP